MTGTKVPNIYLELVDCYKLTIPYNNLLYDIFFDKYMYNMISKYQWHIKRQKNTYYAATYINCKTINMHTLIVNNNIFKLGIDHIDGNGLNNIFNNLRMVTYSQNAMNSRIYCTNTSGIAGVYYIYNRDKYRAHIKFNGIKMNLGNYINIESATYARLCAEQFLFSIYRYKQNDIYIDTLINQLSTNEKININTNVCKRINNYLVRLL